MPRFASRRAAAGPTPGKPVTGRSSPLGRGVERSATPLRAFLVCALPLPSARGGAGSFSLIRVRLSALGRTTGCLLGGQQPPVVRLAAGEAFDLDRGGDACAERGDVGGLERRAVTGDAADDLVALGKLGDHGAERLVRIPPGDDLLADEAHRVSLAEATLPVL